MRGRTNKCLNQMLIGFLDNYPKMEAKVTEPLNKAFPYIAEKELKVAL